MTTRSSLKQAQLAGRRTRGQVLVLACVTMLLTALMIMLSFNLTQAIHEKIRIQSHADSAAYSVALMQARGMNTIAYANRAIAAAMVAQTALHSWMALCSVQVSLHQEFQTAFNIIGGIEIGLCIPCCNPYCSATCYHCKDAAEAFKIAKEHGDKAKDVGDKVKDLDEQFKNGVGQLKEMVTQIKDGEEDVVDKVIAAGKSGSDLLEKLRSINAPTSSYIDNVLNQNEGMFTCTIEGSDKSSCGKGDIALHSKLMQNTANATRPSFQRETGHPDGNIHMDFIPMSSYLMDIQGNEGTHEFSYSSTSRVSDDSSRTADRANELKNAAGFAFNGQLVAQWRHGVGGGAPKAEVLSDTEGGKHEPSDAHDPDHDNMKDCSEEECYISFKSLDDEGKDWGQPSTYAGVQQDLRQLTRAGGGYSMFGSSKGPWEINSTGKVEIRMINGQAAKVTMAAEGTGIAVAKGKTYYHQLGKDGWKHAPNLFDPFWRAKLHPFDKSELAKVLGDAGDSNGEQSINSGAPAEGVK